MATSAVTRIHKNFINGEWVEARQGRTFEDRNPANVAEGEPVESGARSQIPIGAFVLIGLGVLFLLNEMEVLNFDRLWRFWPIVLIAIGIRVLMRRRGMGW